MGFSGAPALPHGNFTPVFVNTLKTIITTVLQTKMIIMKHARFAFVCLLKVLLWTGVVEAQIIPTINIQGVLRNGNGTAVPDGSYSVVFKLYEELEGGSAKWSEMQDIDVTSGIYTTVLGSVTAFSDAVPPVTFDRQYFLEVVVNNKPLLPRVALTPAPYALSLLGSPNTFPSSGAIRADGAVIGEDLDQTLLDLSPEHSIVVKGGTLARGATGNAGTPGADGVNNNGYAFTNDKDSGLFSTGDGKAALYTNNTEQLLVTNDTVKVQHVLDVVGDINASDNLNMPNTKSITYNGQSDWRLVETDYLETDAEGWQVYNPTAGQQGAWEEPSGSTATVTTFTDDFAGKAMVASTWGQVFKKQFTPPQSNVTGAYTYIKVVFRYYLIDSWDFNLSDKGWAAFSKTVDGSSGVSVAWSNQMDRVGQGFQLNYTEFNMAANFYGNSALSDSWVDVSMVARYPSGPSNQNFWVMIGSTLNEVLSDENYGVGMIEIWVK